MVCYCIDREALLFTFEPRRVVAANYRKHVSCRVLRTFVKAMLKTQFEHAECLERAKGVPRNGGRR